jgi:hypothetical protein
MISFSFRNKYVQAAKQPNDRWYIEAYELQAQM